MIYSNDKQNEELELLGEKMKACLEYAASHDLMTMEKGMHAIDGDRFYVNLVEYTTGPASDRIWEAHRKYLDIHYMVDGEEQIDTCLIQNMTVGEYKEESDYLPMEGEAGGAVILHKGDFLVCYPHDGHRTGIQVGEPKTIRKAIFKVLI